MSRQYLTYTEVANKIGITRSGTEFSTKSSLLNTNCNQSLLEDYRDDEFVVDDDIQQDNSGVYIMHRNGQLYLKDDWNFDNNLAEGIVVVKGTRKVGMSLKYFSDVAGSTTTSYPAGVPNYSTSAEAFGDFSYKVNNSRRGNEIFPAYYQCLNTIIGKSNNCYLGTAGEWKIITAQSSEVADTFSKIGKGDNFNSTYFLTSTLRSNSVNWIITKGGVLSQIACNSSNANTRIIPLFDYNLYIPPPDNGVYILHASGKLYAHEDWNLDNSSAVGVVIIDDTKNILISTDNLPSNGNWGSTTSENMSSTIQEAYTDLDGEINTSYMTGIMPSQCKAYTFPFSNIQGYVGSVGEWNIVNKWFDRVNQTLDKINGIKLVNTFSYWTSTQQTSTYAWAYYNKSFINRLKTSLYYTRPFGNYDSFTPPESSTFDVTIKNPGNNDIYYSFGDNGFVNNTNLTKTINLGESVTAYTTCYNNSYKFSYWLDDQNKHIASNPYTFYPVADCTLTPMYVKNTYLLWVQAIGGGKVGFSQNELSLYCSKSKDASDTSVTQVTIYAVADSGNTFKGWSNSVGGSIISTASQITVNFGPENIDYYANFDSGGSTNTEYTVSVVLNSNVQRIEVTGSTHPSYSSRQYFTSSGTMTVYLGDTLNWTAYSKSGYSWSDSSTTTGTTGKIITSGVEIKPTNPTISTIPEYTVTVTLQSNISYIEVKGTTEGTKLFSSSGTAKAKSGTIVNYTAYANNGYCWNNDYTRTTYSGSVEITKDVTINPSNPSMAEYPIMINKALHIQTISVQGSTVSAYSSLQTFDSNGTMYAHFGDVLLINAKAMSGYSWSGSTVLKYPHTVVDGFTISPEDPTIAALSKTITLLPIKNSTSQKVSWGGALNGGANDEIEYGQQGGQIKAKYGDTFWIYATSSGSGAPTHPGWINFDPTYARDNGMGTRITFEGTVTSDITLDPGNYVNLDSVTLDSNKVRIYFEKDDNVIRMDYKLDNDVAYQKVPSYIDVIKGTRLYVVHTQFEDGYDFDRFDLGESQTSISIPSYTKATRNNPYILDCVDFKSYTIKCISKKK